MKIDRQFVRGAIASMMATSIANFINWIFIKQTNTENKFVTFTNLFILGNILAYSLDILIAKTHFNDKFIPYDNVNDRLTYLFRSYLSSNFIKFLITVIIDVMLIYTIFEKIKTYFNHKNIVFKYRDSLIASSISFMTFTLFINILRFKWAYVKSDFTTDLIVYTWLGISAMIFLNNKKFIL